jgi:hypothetical protein
MDSQSRTQACNPERRIRITIESHSERGTHAFAISPKMAVGAFLKLVLRKLSSEGHAERINAMLECYEPVLELYQGNGASPLNNGMTLQQSGVADQSVCRISGRPRKEQLMFCRYS